MELVADDRERSVIAHLEAKAGVCVRRMTVGDYAFVYDGRVVMLVERKTLSDLAASIKDGRMDNHDKLHEARVDTGCIITYIIEGAAYPGLDRKFQGVPYKCLQGKLDSLAFKHGASVVWTKDEAHTACRLVGLMKSLGRMIKDGSLRRWCAPNAAVGSAAEHAAEHVAEHAAKNAAENAAEHAAENAAENAAEQAKPPAGLAPSVAAVLQKKHELTLDALHVKMLAKMPSVSYATASVVLRRYTLGEVLSGRTSAAELRDLKYDTNVRLGERGVRVHSAAHQILTSVSRPQGAALKLAIKMLSCIRGVTAECAFKILERVDMCSLLSGNYEDAAIADIPNAKSTRRLGLALAARVRHALSDTS